MTGSPADVTFPCTACLIKFWEEFIPGQRIETLYYPYNLKTAQAKVAFHFYAVDDLANSSLIARQPFVASCAGVPEAFAALQTKTGAMTPRMFEQYTKLHRALSVLRQWKALLPTPPQIPVASTSMVFVPGNSSQQVNPGTAAQGLQTFYSHVPASS